MKKLFTLFKATTLLLLTMYQTGAQAQLLTCGMNFNVFSRTYTYLADANPVDAIETDDGFQNNIPLGFSFRFGNCSGPSAYTTVHVSSNGWLKFGTAPSGSFPNPNTQSVFPGLWPLYSNLSGTGGTASYKTDILPAGTKVFTMEWKDWRWNNAATSASISFQVKLYEGSDIIEYCYKQEAAAITGTTAAMIGMGRTKPPTTPASATPCPGYDYMIITDVPATPTMNINGSYGPALLDRPNTDAVYQFYQKCCGKPTAGSIVQPDSVCPGAPFTAKLSGATPSPFVAYGVTYQWQAAPAATGTWGNIPGVSTLYTFPSGITTDTFLRVIVTCGATGLKDTTPVHHIKMIKLSYNCYCYSSATNDLIKPSLVNIGNVKLITAGRDTLIDTGLLVTKPFVNKGPYSDYTLRTGIRPIAEINRDTTYTWSVMGITTDTFAFSPTGVALYIDYNADGIYDPSAEFAGFKVLSGTTTNFIPKFTVPNGAVLDTVGMRVIMKKDATSPADIVPCAGFTEGETEDFLVQITNPRCGGPLLPGTAFISDSAICPGYKTLIWDNTHARNMSSMHWQWEYSLDNVFWTDVTAGRNVDTLDPVVRQSTYYRLRIVCEASKDTIFSNKVYIKLKQPYKCYCYSLADGNDGNLRNDSADITTVELNKFVMNSGGPHLLNPGSIRMRTDNTHLDPVELVAGNRYPIAVFHTLFGKYHSNAKITVFMDFNQNLAYDAPAERIWTRFTSSTNYFVHDSITIPIAVIPNIPVGMRVVLNSNTGANSPSDDGCGAYTSGETEDYLVIFRRPSTDIGEMTNISDLQIFPNPTNGLFIVSFAALTAVNEATVTVTNMTGQKVLAERYDNVSNSFSRTLSLTGQASGVYFITLTADGQSTVHKVVLR